MEHVESPYRGVEQSPSGLVMQGIVAVLMLIPVTLPVPVLRELVHERFQVSEFLTSLFMSINMVGAVLAAPLMGTLADRWGQRKRMVLWALALDAFCFFAMTAEIPFSAFMSLRFIEGAAHITALSMLLSLASTSVRASHRGRAMGWVGAGLLFGVAIGAPIGGAVGALQPVRTLWLGGFIVLIAAALSVKVLRDGDMDDREPWTFSRLLVAFRTHRRLAIPLLFAFADRFTVGFYTTTFSLYVSRIHGADPPQIGLLISAFMLPFALLSYPFGLLSERTSRVGLLGVGSILYGIGTATLVLWPAAWLPFVMASIGIAAAVMFVPTMLLVTEYAPDDLRSTALSAFNAAGSLGFIVGPLVGGAISVWFGSDGHWEEGYGMAFAVAGGSELILVAIALPLLYRMR